MKDKNRNDSDQPNLLQIIKDFQRDYLDPCKEQGASPLGRAIIYRISTNDVIAVNDLVEFLQVENIPTSDVLKLTWFHDGGWETSPAAIDRVQRLWPAQAQAQGSNQMASELETPPEYAALSYNWRGPVIKAIDKAIQKTETSK